MVLGGQRKRSVIAVTVLGAVLIALASALNVGWIVANWRSGLFLIFGVLCFMVLIAGLGLNTVFLVREIRRNEQHDAFINAVTHELKTPVASIKLYLQTMRQRDLERDKRDEFVDVMLQDSERLQNTIDQVLLAGKTGSARRVLEKAEVDLVDLVGDCVRLAGKRHNLTDRELRLVEPREEEAIVLGDPDEIRAAVANLIDNAVKYSGESIDIAVEVVFLSVKRAAIRVRDRGIGITREELKRIFKRFYRIPGAGPSRVKGTGLGLAIVRSVAKRHGGKAYAESQGAGKGSVFTLELPLKSA